MPSVTQHNQRKALDRWARTQGYNDFDTYIATGGSILACREDVLHQREDLDLMLDALLHLSPISAGRLPPQADAVVVGPAALARAEAEQAGEADARNAALEGGEA